MARELKYNTHFTDLEALQRELGTSDTDGVVHAPGATSGSDDAEDEYDEWESGSEADPDYEHGWTGTDR